MDSNPKKRRPAHLVRAEREFLERVKEAARASRKTVNQWWLDAAEEYLDARPNSLIRR